MAELKASAQVLESVVLCVREVEQGLARVVGELAGELTALRASTRALVESNNVHDAEEHAASVRRHLGLAAYGEWGAEFADGQN